MISEYDRIIEMACRKVAENQGAKKRLVLCPDGLYRAIYEVLPGSFDKLVSEHGWPKSMGGTVDDIELSKKMVPK